jgi:hypothetical protein
MTEAALDAAVANDESCDVNADNDQQVDEKD